MDKQHIQLLLIFFFSYVSLISISTTYAHCPPASCGRIEIRYPFRIIDQQPSSCGVLGFDLYCNKKNQTIIQFPSTRSYTINRINYDSRVLYIHQDFCHRKEINDLDFTDTPFVFPNQETYIFYNCSIQNFSLAYPSVPFPCLNSRNHSVIAVREEANARRSMRMPSRCKVIKWISVSVPLNGDIRSDMELMWFDPFDSCLFKSCESKGISTIAKYGVSLGIGVPMTIFIIGMIWCMACRVTDNSETHHQSIAVSPIAIIPQPPSSTGLDGPTIESYPITMLGESCRLPNDDKACAICISDYKPEEMLRTIPQCNHCFHVGCIDEWLKLNATCPVCRNTPKSSSLVTTLCSSASTNYVESS